MTTQQMIREERIPRASGGDPVQVMLFDINRKYSPRKRG